jgi:hypothetical protein
MIFQWEDVINSNPEYSVPVRLKEAGNHRTTPETSSADD